MCLSKRSSDSQSRRMPINDAILISWLKENFKDIGFIGRLEFDSYGRNKQLSDDIGSLKSEPPLYRQKELILRIWRNLVENAIVYLKSKDCRETYHDDEAYGVERLYKFFETFRDFEGLLYGAEQHNRDHMSHMFSVFLLGEYLIKERITFEKIDVGDRDLPDKQKISADEKEAMWCIMSLTHDLGYALQTIPGISGKARGMLEEFGIINIQDLSYGFPRQPLHDFMIQFISSDLQRLPTLDTETERFTPHIQSKYFLKFSEAFERRDHGVVSCLVLMKNLVYFLETDFLLDPHKPFNLLDARQFLIRRNILRPIASHSCDDIYYQTLREFGFLLTIFDEMQEWDRPRLTDLFVPKTPKTRLIVEHLSDTEIHYKIEVRHPGPLLEEERKRIEQDADEYFRRKYTRIRRILRSAVAEFDRPRELKLTFEMSHTIGPEIRDYKIIHETPQDVKVFKPDQKESPSKNCKQKRQNE